MRNIKPQLPYVIALFALIVFGRAAYALDEAGAASNLTILEYALQQAEYCEKSRPGTREKYFQWRKGLPGVEEKSIRAIDEHAKRKNLSPQERAEVISGVKEFVRQKVMSTGDVQRGSCAQFEQDLVFYAKHIKE